MKFTRQPQYPVPLDMGHSSLQNCLRFYHFAPYYRKGVTSTSDTPGAELFTNAPFTIGPTSPLFEPSFGSVVWNQSGTYAESNDSYRNQITNKLTAFVDFDGVAINAGQQSFIFGDVQSSSTGYNWGIYTTTDGKPIAFLKTGGSGASITGITASVTGKRSIVFLTYDGVNLRIYVNGNIEGQTGKTGNVDTTSFSTCFSRWNNVTLHSYRFRTAGIFNRVWSDQEIRKFCDNPWQVFQGHPSPISRRINSIVAGAATTNRQYSFVTG